MKVKKRPRNCYRLKTLELNITQYPGLDPRLYRKVSAIKDIIRIIYET